MPRANAPAPLAPAALRPQPEHDAAVSQLSHLRVIDNNTQVPFEAITDDEVWKEIRASFTAGAEDTDLAQPVNDAIEDGAEPLYQCHKCANKKLENDYYRSKANKRGFAYICKVCHGEKNKASRQRKVERERMESIRSGDDNAGEQAEALADICLAPRAQSMERQ
jgi:hypothetical protein